MPDIDILLVDPHEDDVDAITHTLERVGTITHVPDTATAWAMLGLRPFDIVLTEYTLEDGHGFDLLEMTIPLVLLTHETNPHAIIRAMQHGVTDYILKEDGYLSKLRLTVNEIVTEHRRSEVHKHLAFDSSIAGHVRMTSDCRPIECNEKAAQLLGYTSVADAITQVTWRKHFPEEVQSVWHEADIHHVIIQNYHTLLYNRDHHTIPVVCNIATVTHPENDYFVDIVFLDVTDRLNSNTSMPYDVKVLEQSHAWISHILDNTTDVIIVTDHQGVIQHTNNRFETLFLHEPTETVFDLFPAPYDLHIANLMDDALTFNMRLLDEVMIHQMDGTRLYVEVNIAIMDTGDRRRNLILTIHNIDERKRAEQMLAQSEADLRAIFESTTVGFMLLDTSMSVRTANGMATDIVQEILGHKLSAGSLPPHLEAFVSDFQQALGGTMVSSDLSLTIEGETRDYALTFIPVQNDRHDIIGVCLSTEDITARRRAELALSASEKRYRTITELISDYAYSLQLQPTGDLTISWITEAPFERVTGYDAATFSTMQAIIDRMMLPEDRERATRDLKRCLKGQTTTSEYRILTHEEKSRWVQVTRRPIWDEQAQTYNQIVGAVRDITIERQMEQALRDSLAKERELNELKSRFISMVSHEFRTPLATIQASTDMLNTYADRMTPEQREERFNRIKLQIHHMTGLMEDVLSLGRYEAGVSSFNAQELDLIAFLMELVEEFEQTYPTHYMRCVVPSEPLHFTFDPNLMRQITLNLLTNAEKYSDEGTTITLEVSVTDTHVEIAVSDEGIGIPEADQQKLFTAFHRASNVGTIQGTGLGLSILKHAVEQHDGTITLASEEGQGTTFTVSLPR